jgi:hypothetical protein
MRLNFFSLHARLLSLLVILAASSLHATAQQGQLTNSPPKAAPAEAPPAETEKAEAVIRRAVEALGGGAFLGVKTVVGRGHYTPYLKGEPGDLVTFLDYIVFPEVVPTEFRERTEFRSRGVRSIQTNVGTGPDSSGWVFDGMTKTIQDMRPEQIEDFRYAMRTSLDNLLRGWWRKEGAQLSYLGRREAGLARRNEAVRLTYPDGFTVDYEFGARDFLPAKAAYKRKDKEGKEHAEEDRYVRHMTFGGVTVPYVIDHYREGVQTSRINFDAVEFNRPVPEDLFAKPANVKAIK